MQTSDEQAQEVTYAAQLAERTYSMGPGQASAASQHIVAEDTTPDDRNAQIYSYLTSVAERCHDARVTRVNEVNNPSLEAL